MTATLIERFPDGNDPQRPVEEKHAKDVAAISYIGLWWHKYTLNGRHTDFFYHISTTGSRRWYGKNNYH
jgi:hypothetical protein